MSLEQNSAMDLVLGGGGIKGFAHIGVLKALLEKQIVIDNIVGVSVGSIVAAFHTNGFTPDEITEQFLKGLARRFCPRLWFRSYMGFDPMMFVGGFYPSLLGPIQDMVKLHRLKPQPNLKIVAFDILSCEPAVFEDTDYDLSYALAATCALPGVFKSVPYDSKTGERQLLVDGALHHRNPTEFCSKSAIVSKLGFATKMPKDILPPWELWWHLREMYGVVNQERHDIDASQHHVIYLDMPQIAGLSFSLSRKTCLGMIETGYEQTMEMLANISAKSRTGN